MQKTPVFNRKYGKNASTDNIKRGEFK